MNTDIRDWRPKLWSDFIGESNQRQIEPLRRECLLGIRPKPLLLTGSVGSAKTSLARHLIASYCCPNANLGDGNPCGRCSECQSQGPDFNGDGSRFRHYEIDCTGLVTRADICEWLEVCFSDERVACFWDEAHRLSDNDKIELLLKPVERFRGLFILAMTNDRLATINAAMLDRLRVIRLSQPTLNEFVNFLESKAPAWNITTSHAVLRQLARNKSQSFRACLDVLQLAVHVNGGTLDMAFLERACAMQPTGLDQYE
jgi:DNA polymerase III gamma/tau subunit